MTTPTIQEQIAALPRLPPEFTEAGRLVIWDILCIKRLEAEKALLVRVLEEVRPHCFDFPEGLVADIDAVLAAVKP